MKNDEKQEKNHQKCQKNIKILNNREKSIKYIEKRLNI